jgi:signal transduction histidine kinase
MDKLKKNNLILLAILLIILVFLYQPLYAKTFIVWNNNIFEYESGFGIVKFGTKEIVNNKLPRWLFHITKPSKGVIYANAFNGVNYLGIIKINLNDFSYRIADLTKEGSFTNYIEDIVSKNDLVFVKIFGKYFSLTSDLKNFREVNLGNLRRVKKFFVYKNKLFAFIDNSLYEVNTKNYSINESNIYVTESNDEKIKYVDKNIIISKLPNQLKIFDYSKDKLIKFYFLEKISKIENFGEFYILVDRNDQCYIFGGEYLGVLPPDFGLPIFFNHNTKEIIYLRDGKILKSKIGEDNTCELEISMINNLIRIKPNIDKGGKYLIATNLDPQRREFRKINEITISKDYDISKLKINIFTDRFNLIKRRITIDKIYTSINLDSLLLKISLVFSVLILLIVLGNIFYLYPILLFPIPLFLINPILSLWGLYIEGIYFWLLIVVFFTIAIFFLKYSIQKIRKLGQDLTYIHSFNHGSYGTNNLTRIYRLSEYDLIVKDRKIKELFFSAGKIYLKNTDKILIKFLRNITIYNSFKIIILLMSIDINRIRLKQHLYKLLKLKISAVSEKNFKKTRKLVKNILRNVERVGKYCYHQNSITINELTKEIIRVINSTAIKDKVELILNANKYERVLLTKDDLSEILDNLIMNSVEISLLDDRPLINIIISENNNSVLLEFINSGPLIPEEKVPQLFKNHYSTKKNGGTGLITIKKTLEKYLGTINYKVKDNLNSFEIALRKIDG